MIPMMKVMFATLLMSGAAVAGTTTTPSSVSSIPDGRVARFDVAGVRLGMTPDQAQRAMAAAGYRLDHWARGASFEQRVAAEVARRRPASAGKTAPAEVTPISLWGDGPNGEKLWIKFQPLATGSIVKFVQITTNPRRSTTEAVQAQVWQKYGAPTGYVLDWNRHFWCDLPADICGREALPQYHTLSFGTYPEPALKLSDEYRLERIGAEAIVAEVERRAPRGGAAL
jgi:hypothetical protein